MAKQKLSPKAAPVKRKNKFCGGKSTPYKRYAEGEGTVGKWKKKKGKN